MYECVELSPLEDCNFRVIDHETLKASSISDDGEVTAEYPSNLTMQLSAQG